MCFCATVNFAGSAVLGVVGVAALLEVKHRRELLFAALPSLFALHQFTEGFVWLGLTHVLPAWVGQYAGPHSFFTPKDYYRSFSHSACF
jgi:hypothetical protein